MQRVLVALAAAGLWLATSQAALCAEVVGSVSDTGRHPVVSVEIKAKDGAGKIFGAARTDREGRYRLRGLPEGTYTFALDADGTGLKGGEAVAYLGPKGLTINWKLSTNAQAIAMATEGTDAAVAGGPFGFSPLAVASFGASGLAVGGALGGYAAAGGFSGQAASPAQ